MGFSCSFTLLQLGMPIYKNAVYAERLGASALASDLILRYALSSPFPLFTVQMIHKMSFRWAISLLGFISLPITAIPFVLHRHGRQMRAKSPYLMHRVEDHGEGT